MQGAFQRMASHINESNWDVLLLYIQHYHDVVKLPNPLTDVLQKVTSGNPKFKPFRNALGAVDGSLIPCLVRSDDFPRFLCRKGFTALNLLALVTFRFTFAMCEYGIEGAACDSPPFESFMRPMIDDPTHTYYYLGDGIFRNSLCVLSPFRGITYHLKDWAATPDRVVKDKFELFNLRHAQLRNIVERLFGCLKMKFRILKKRLIVDVRQENYVDRYSRMLMAIVMLFNEMRSTGEIVVDDFKKARLNRREGDGVVVEGEIEQDGDEDERQEQDGPTDNDGDMRRMRITDELWAEYERQHRHEPAVAEIGRIEAMITEIFDNLLNG